MEVKSTFQEIQELNKQFKTFKGKLTVEELNDLISKVKTVYKDRRMSTEIYTYCKEHHPKIIQVVKQFRTRTKKKDNQIVIEGETGSGKSVMTLCLLCCLAHLFDRELNLERNVIYFPKTQELSERLTILGEKEILWVDETIKSLYKGRWMNKDAMASNETVQTERFRNNTVAYCLPNFSELTKSFRDVNIKFRIWCVSTDPAAAVVRVKEKHPDIIQRSGAWHSEERFQTLKKRNISPLSTTDEYLNAERQMDGYAADFDWPDLQNVPELCGWHLLYELFKKRSRVMAKEEEVEDGEEKLTKLQSTRRALIIGMMATIRLSDPELKCIKWYRANKSFLNALSYKTIQRYWLEAEEKMAERNLKKADVANILPYGRVVLEPESDVRGAFKYTFESNAMGTVIMFRGDSELSVITAYRKNWR